VSEPDEGSQAPPTDGTGPLILGLAASHNGAACLLHGDRIVAAVQEERLTREKRAMLRPSERSRAVEEVLRAAGVTAAELDLIVVCPLRTAADPTCDPSRNPTLAGRPHATVSHHRAHALSAFALSGFEEAAVIVADGMGSVAEDLDVRELEVVIGPRAGRETASIYAACAEELRPVEKQLGTLPEPTPGRAIPSLMPFASLGTMYQAVAHRAFGGWYDAGKVMGLAPYGEARWPVEAFFTCEGPRLVFSEGIRRAFSPRRLWPAHRRDYEDLARSVQEACEEGMLHLARRARELTGHRRLCLAGGVALNGIANERIIRSGLFDEVFIIPAAEDSGTAIGAAVHGLWGLAGHRPLAPLREDALGPEYAEEAMEAAIARRLPGSGATASRPADLAAHAARRLAEGAAVGWFAGRSELGPRALGHRSILFDPRRADGRDHLNARVKHREAFRPYAPAVLASEARAWFDLGPCSESPFMLRVVPVHPERRATIPAVVHVDGSARVQTVCEDGGPFHRVIEAFHRETGVPMVLNTSFNVAGEPLVETPEDALGCLLGTALDACALGPWWVEKLS